jgi:hypothetical protein
MLISIALLLDSIIRNSVCTPAKLPYRAGLIIYPSKLSTKNKSMSAKFLFKMSLLLFGTFYKAQHTIPPTP